MHGSLALLLLISIYFALGRTLAGQSRRPRVIVSGGIPVGQNEAAPRPWFCLLMTVLIFCVILMLTNWI